MVRVSINSSSSGPRRPARAIGSLSRRVRHRSWGAAFMATALAGVILWAPEAAGEVLHSQQSALKLAFPGAVQVTPKNVFLTQAEVKSIQSQSGARLDSRMITVYVGRKSGLCTGYAFLDTHRVRTKPETLMIVITPQGQVEAVHVLAFFEPKEYLPRPRWLGQFKRRGLSSRLQVGYQIAGVAGATMTTQAVTQAVRRALAVHRVALGDGKRLDCDGRAKER